MSSTERPDSKLPVTGEVGSEGGSPADAVAGRLSIVGVTRLRRRT